jgi:hypothetical protein
MDEQVLEQMLRRTRSTLAPSPVEQQAALEGCLRHPVQDIPLTVKLLIPVAVALCLAYQPDANPEGLEVVRAQEIAMLEGELGVPSQHGH